MSSVLAVLLLTLFLFLSIIAALNFFKQINLQQGIYIPCLWILILYLVIFRFVGQEFAIWILAALSFAALREYFSLIDLRLQDRLSVFGAYLAIPCMSYLIMNAWYQMFILFIPVYAVFATALLATYGGGDYKGTVFSIGAINFGLFLFVYCIGHLGFLTGYSPWLSLALILNIIICDLAAFLISRHNKFSGQMTLSIIPVTALTSLALSPLSGISRGDALLVGAITPPLVAMSRRTMSYIEADLGIDKKKLRPGKGQLIDSLKSYLYVAPVILHYITYIMR